MMPCPTQRKRNMKLDLTFNETVHICHGKFLNELHADCNCQMCNPCSSKYSHEINYPKLNRFSADRDFIAGNKSTSRLIESYSFGWIVDPLIDPIKKLEALRDALSEFKECARLSSNGRVLTKEEFTFLESVLRAIGMVWGDASNNEHNLKKFFQWNESALMFDDFDIEFKDNILSCAEVVTVDKMNIVIGSFSNLLKIMGNDTEWGS